MDFAIKGARLIGRLSRADVINEIVPPHKFKAIKNSSGEAGSESKKPFLLVPSTLIPHVD